MVMTRCSVLYSRCTKYKRFHLLFAFSLLGMLLMLLGVMCEDENDAATNENNENENKNKGKKKQNERRRRQRRVSAA